MEEGTRAGAQGIGRRRRPRRHRRRCKRKVVATQADAAAPGATDGDAAATSLQVSVRCVRAVVSYQQIFRRGKRARDKKEHRRRSEQRALERWKGTLLPHAQRAKRE